MIKLRIYHMTFEKPEIFWGGNSTNSVKECLHRAEQLDCLQSVFDFRLFTAVVVHVTERWSPTKQYSLSSLDIRVKLRQPSTSFGYVDTAWQSAWREVEPVIAPTFFKFFWRLLHRMRVKIHWRAIGSGLFHTRSNLAATQMEFLGLLFIRETNLIL